MALASMPNVYENRNFLQPTLINDGKDVIDMRGRWASDHFKNDAPIILELACGRGEYSVAMAQMFPSLNFIGVDIKGARIWKGASIARDLGLMNVAFLRTKIEIIQHFFDQSEVSEIWITFPDPFLKKGKSNRRLTAPNFLGLYKKILSPEGLIHLKTDSDELTAFTLEVLERSKIPIQTYIPDLYVNEKLDPKLEIKTYYERMHLDKGKKIKYLTFRL
jgi:tRNA (guanine-N7-)-methyltransferase